MIPAEGDERVLFEEHLWFPWWCGALIFAFSDGVMAAVIVIGRPDLTSALIALGVGTGTPILIWMWFAIGSRKVWNRVGERTLRFGRARPVPVEAVREVRLVTGKREVKSCKASLRRGARFFGSSWNPNLKGILAPPGTETAVLITVDPTASRTHMFLLGNRRPHALLDALSGVVPPPTDAPGGDRELLDGVKAIERHRVAALEEQPDLRRSTLPRCAVVALIHQRNSQTAGS